MRYYEIISENGMSGVAHTVEDIRNLDSMLVIVDFSSETIFLRFMLYDQPGKLVLRPKPNVKFKAKIYAAAIAINNGKKPTWDMVASLVTGRISTQAIKILTNPATWKVVGLNYGDINF